ncbi:unnamed protein product [Rotaria socialis]|uniref:Uncharacterized protein n=1 Tax=Rotaria socialis TaxID=392032 RepID=A0A820QDR4_9BILA|nr:unnamed protein product [Rotaria socialis]CAF4422565.1 unnamed protein product [Rotaria socialis]
MKRSVSSISNSRDTISSRLKRNRLMNKNQNEENISNINKNVAFVRGKENSISNRSGNSKEKFLEKNIDLDDNSSIRSGQPPLQSTISFSSPSSLSENHNHEVGSNMNQTSQLHNNDPKSSDNVTNSSLSSQSNLNKKQPLQKIRNSTQVDTNRNPVSIERNPVSTERNPVSTERNRVSIERNPVSTERNLVSTERNPGSTERNRVSIERNRVSTEPNRVSTERNPGSTERSPNTQPLPSRLSKDKTQVFNRHCSVQSQNQSVTHNNSNRLSTTVDLRFSTPKLSGSALIEGSLEYRELKRSYLFEKKQAEEWKKDYMVLKQQFNELKSSTLPRPTAEVIEWLKELFDLLNNNGTFRGDGRNLTSVGKDLGLDEANLITVAARTPQKSALKLFRLIYPTIGLRAGCVSISNVPEEQLQNIYQYVRILHPSLGFKMADMRRAIGNSIRSATHEMRKLEYQRQEKLNELQNDENLDPDERDERIQDALDTMQMALDANDVNEYDQDSDNDEVDNEVTNFNVDDDLNDDEVDEADEDTI